MPGLPEIEGVIDLVEVGRGGFGVVYRGTETEFGRVVAVKVLLPSVDERTRKRFERERRAMGTVSDHPNIVTVYRGGLTESNQPYLVMEYLPGGSLADQLDATGPVDWRAAATIGAKLAEALHAAHRAGILHRDVKPGNILQTIDGEPKLGDFGIARFDDGHDSRTGSITASVAHAPPEIVDGQRGDERSDVYSLASTVYALTIGAAPFSRDADQGLAALLSRIAHSDPPGMHLESAATEFELAIFKALSKNPDDRHETMQQFGNELHRAARAPITQPLPRATDVPAAQAPPVLAHSTADAPASGAEPALAAPEVPLHRRAGFGQMLFFAVLALAIAGFGGWAVARAAFNPSDDQDRPFEITQPVDPTSVPPTAVPPTAVPPTEVPPTDVPPTAIPETPDPTPPPTPSPANTTGTGLDIPPGFTTITDSTRAISVAVPADWISTTQDYADLQRLGGTEGGFLAGLSVGGTFRDFSGDPEIWDLTQTGIRIWVVRLGGPSDDDGLLDIAVADWSNCDQGERSELLHPQGVARFQILACDRSETEASGVVVGILTLRDHPDVIVSIALQLADIADVNQIDAISLIEIDESKIPELETES